MMERDLPGAERNVVKDPLAKLQDLDATNREFRDVIDLYLAGNYKEMTLTRLTDEDVAPLCRTLGPSDAIVTLDLRYNCITDTGAAYIAKMLEENVCLKSLNLMHNDFGSEGARLIANALETNSTLEMLRVNGNKIGDVGGLWFAQMLQVNETLEYLDLGDTDLRIESLIAFATVLLRNTSLKALNVNRPLLFTRGEETTVHFGHMLKVNTSLKELHLQKYDMRDFGAARLAENLSPNLTLTYLNLSCNRITRDGAEHLTSWLRTDPPLQVLDLSCNRLGDPGLRILADVLSHTNSNLRHLSVRYNEASDVGLTAVADAFKFNQTLEAVYIWGNDLGRAASLAFRHLVESGRLKPEVLDTRTYVVDGVSYLCEQDVHPRRFYYRFPWHGDDAPTNPMAWPC